MPCGLWDLSSPSRDLITREFLSSLFVLSLLLVLEKEMAAHSSILAWKIPWTEEPDGLGGLQSMGSQSDVTERLTLSLRLHTALL